MSDHVGYRADAARFFHLFPGRGRGVLDAGEAEAEFVRVGRAAQCFVEGDEALLVEVEKRLVKGLHAVLRRAGGDGVADRRGLILVEDVIADQRR